MSIKDANYARYQELLRRVLAIERRLTSGGGGVPDHASTHSDGGGDEVDLTDLGGFPGNTTTFLRGDGTFATPSVGALAEANDVVTLESTNSTTYTDLATSGPAVTLTTGTEVIVWLSAIGQKTTSSNTAFISVAVSGATTGAAIDNNAAAAASPGASFAFTLSRVLTIAGLTPGSNTFTMKYRVDGGTFSFLNRSIAVLAL